MARRKTQRKNKKSSTLTQTTEQIVRSLAERIGLAEDEISPTTVLQRIEELQSAGEIPKLSEASQLSPALIPKVTQFNQGCDEADWTGGIQFINSELSPALSRRADSLRVSFLEVSENEHVMARVRDGDDVHIAGVFCNAEQKVINFVCDCSVNHQVCAHAGAVASLVLEEMKLRDSKIRKEIVEKLGLVEDLSSLPGAKTLMKLVAILKVGDSDQQEEPFEIAQTKQRVLWRIANDYGSFVITPVVQQRKKSGKGWTKGREMMAETLKHGGYLLSTVDHKVLETMDRSYYGYQVETFPALLQLVGHDAVEYRGKPATVTRKPFELVVCWSEDQRELEVRIEPDCDQLSVDDDGIVALKRNTFTVIEIPDKLSSIAFAASSGDLSVPADRADELLDRMQKLSRTVSVQLPKDAFAKSKTIKVDPVLRIKSFKSGELRCGLRVRDGDRLHQPGQGQLVRYQKSKRELIRHTRNGSSEIEACGAIRDALNFPSHSMLSEWDWQFRDFEESLNLLERLGTLGDELGIEALWDEDSVKPVSIMGAITANNVRVDVQRKKDWFGIEGGVQLGGQTFTLPELLSAMDTEPAKGFTELRPGMWAKVSERLRKRLLELRDAAHANRSKLELDITAMPVIQSLRESELDITASKEWDESVRRMTKAQKICPKPSKKFKATLRDYQLDGYRWMRRLAEWGVGACLADDMGLGKTVQTLAVLVDRAKKGPTLVVAPTSVGFNWHRETEKFAPSLKPHLYRETERTSFLESVGTGDVVICSYGLALRDAAGLAKVKWGTLVLDEAQFIKNSRSKTALAIRTFEADWKLALTGTPIENHLGELWSLFRSISPGLFGSWEQFRKRFATPIEKQDNQSRRQALSRLITPFILRRTKGEVLKDLPERTEINLHVDLTEGERARYDEMRLAAIGELDQIVGLPDTQDQRFRILAILTRLRQMACHVGMVDEAWDGESAKLKLLVEKIVELKEEGHRVLIFSQFTKYLALIRKSLAAEDVSMEYLDGKTPAKTRQERVDRFQEGDTDAFLISLKAGGTGLNLTAADYVIHMDPWWNPAVEDQATDRAYRIGQTKGVVVHRLITEGTVEDRVADLLRAKRALAASITSGGESWIGELDDDDLAELVELSVN